MKNATPEKLREAVTEIDSMSQCALGEIATLAKLALASLETPNGCSDIDSIATVFSAIWGRAGDAKNYINCMAEDVGCHFKDEAMTRRGEALRMAEAAKISMGVTQ